MVTSIPIQTKTYFLYLQTDNKNYGPETYEVTSLWCLNKASAWQFYWFQLYQIGL